jgi:5-methylcytosine-specific restriction endonuclease McrA
MNSPFLFEAFSDDELIAETKRLVSCERAATAALLRSLMEIDTRRLYLREGCSSLFTYCTHVLHLAEGAAYNRIEAARAARRFPMILEALADGFVTLTSIRLLAPHLTDQNYRELLDAAHHKNKREIELLVATLKPKPPAMTVIRKLPADAAAVRPVVVSASMPPTSDVGADGSGTHPATDRDQQTGVGADCLNRPTATQIRSIVSPLSSQHYKLQLTISRDTHDKLRRAQDLLRHTIPDGDIAALIDRALTLLLADLERRRCAATPAPRAASRAGTIRGRHIPAAVRRQVWQRDQGRCAFVGTSGRCRETGFLEFHHVEPYAGGGPATVENIQLRCRAHNQYEAARFFGGGYDRVKECAPLGW